MVDEEEYLDVKNRVVCLKADLERLNDKYIHEKVAKEELEEILENSISKDIIREKIENLVNKIDGTNKGFIYACEVDLLEELLGE